MDFAFDMIAFGETPPAITGISISEKCENQDTIIIDLDMMFNSNGDIGFTVKNMKANVIDFNLEGTLRIVLKPLVTKVPLIGGVQIYFPTAPTITFELGGLGKVAHSLGLKEKIYDVVNEKISDKLVLPNKITKSFTKEISKKELFYPNPSGVLRVHLIKAENLVNKDTNGKSDPYAVLSVSSKSFRSETILNDLNPEWSNFKVDFPMESIVGQELTIELFDEDLINDDTLGYATIAASTVAQRKQIDDMWINLENTVTGKVQLSLTWFEVSNAEEDIAKLKKGISKICLLTVFMDSCKCLNMVAGPLRYKKTIVPSPYVIMAIEGVEKQSTMIRKTTIDPTFQQSFTFVVANPHDEKLKIEVLDSSTKETILGKLDIAISDLIYMVKMGFSVKPFDLQNGKGIINLSAKLLALKNPII